MIVTLYFDQDTITYQSNETMPRLAYEAALKHWGYAAYNFNTRMDIDSTSAKVKYDSRCILSGTKIKGEVCPSNT